MWTRVVAAAACFAAIMGFSRLAYGVLVPAIQHSLGGGYALYGAIGAANLFGYFVGTLGATRLAARHDRAHSNAGALVAMCAAMAASALVRDPLQLGLLRFAVGAASGVALALTLSLAVEGVSPARRGLAAAIVWGGGALGIALVGAVPLGWSTQWRAEWLAMALAGVACAAVFAWLTGRSNQAAPARVHANAGGAVFGRDYLPLTVAYFAFGFGYIDLVTFLGASLARTHGLPPGTVWIVLGTTGVAGAAVWGPVVDRFRSGLPVAVACGLCAAGALLLALGSPSAALIGSLAVGVSFIGVPAMVGALVQQRERPAHYAGTFAAVTAVLACGQVLGPLVGGFAAERLGTPAALYVAAAALAVAASLAAAYRAPARVRPARLENRLAERGEDQADREFGRAVALV
jgi:predicted MFS family arabinose efflux permease